MKQILSRAIPSPELPVLVFGLECPFARSPPNCKVRTQTMAQVRKTRHWRRSMLANGTRVRFARLFLALLQDQWTKTR